MPWRSPRGSELGPCGAGVSTLRVRGVERRDFVAGDLSLAVADGRTLLDGMHVDGDGLVLPLVEPAAEFGGSGEQLLGVEVVLPVGIGLVAEEVVRDEDADVAGLHDGAL